MSIRIEDLAKTDLRSVTVAGGKRIAPTSPGEMLREEFLKPMGITNYRLARDRCAGAAHRRHHRGQAGHHGGYGSAAVPLLWTHRRLVAAARSGLNSV